jgi:hypothetical protein
MKVESLNLLKRKRERSKQVARNQEQNEGGEGVSNVLMGKKKVNAVLSSFTSFHANMGDSEKITVLHEAARLGKKSLVLFMLEEVGADVNGEKSYDREGENIQQTAFHIAVELEHK